MPKEDSQAPYYVHVLEKYYSGAKRDYSKTPYIVVSEQRVERAVPDELHRILTRVINTAIFSNDFSYIQDDLSKLRDALILMNDTYPLFTNLHVLFMKGYNFDGKAQEHIVRFLNDIMKCSNTVELVDFIQSMLNNIKLFDFYIKKRVLLFKRKLANARVLIFDKYSDRKIAECITNTEGMFSAYLLPYLPYEICWNDKCKDITPRKSPLVIVF